MCKICKVLEADELASVSKGISQRSRTKVLQTVLLLAENGKEKIVAFFLKGKNGPLVRLSLPDKPNGKVLLLKQRDVVSRLSSIDPERPGQKVPHIRERINTLSEFAKFIDMEMAKFLRLLERLFTELPAPKTELPVATLA